MGYKIIIYKDNKFYKEENLKQNWENFIYKWGNIEPGSYFFEIKNIIIKVKIIIKIDEYSLYIFSP